MLGLQHVDNGLAAAAPAQRERAVELGRCLIEEREADIGPGDRLADSRFHQELAAKGAADVRGCTVERAADAEIGSRRPALRAPGYLFEQILLEEFADRPGGRRLGIRALLFGHRAVALLPSLALCRNGLALGRDRLIARRRGGALGDGSAVGIAERGRLGAAGTDGLPGTDHHAGDQDDEDRRDTSNERLMAAGELPKLITDGRRLGDDRLVA